MLSYMGFQFPEKFKQDKTIKKSEITGKNKTSIISFPWKFFVPSLYIYYHSDPSGFI